MATKQISTNQLVNISKLSFIRPQKLSFEMTSCKPDTKLYCFFDNISVDKYITPTGLALGDQLKSTASGFCSGTFIVPSNTFNTGERQFTVQDNNTLDTAHIPGSSISGGSARFTASGLLETWQKTISNITSNVVEHNIVDGGTKSGSTINIRREFLTDQNLRDMGFGGYIKTAPTEPIDPLAQTFFTYGVIGGCYVTKIDVFFQTKDATLPVTLEIRNVVNGYPGPKVVSEWASLTIEPSHINISNNASVPSSFTFRNPIYLESDTDYCFVLISNSNSYNVYTSEIGGKSLEDGTTIFEQPYIGSMFKSENNITWTAEQTQDIKFNIYKAKFDITSRDVTFVANSSPVLLPGSSFSVISGSPVVTVSLPFEHGNRTGEFISFEGIVGGKYMGIPSAIISNPSGFSISYIDEYHFTFNVGVNATATGVFTASGILNQVAVDAGGTNYISPSIIISGGGGTGATAVAYVEGGVITDVRVTNTGTGYTSTPTLSLSDAVGTGAILVPISEAVFVTNLNRQFQNAMPEFTAFRPSSTKITSSLRTTDLNYLVGQHNIHELNFPRNVNKNAVLVSPSIEATSFGENNSTQLIARMESDNVNVSPVIDMNTPPRLRAHNILINNVGQNSELTPADGTSFARYITKINVLENISTGARLVLNAASMPENSIDVYLRTSVSTAISGHKTNSWIPMTCAVTRNKSTSTNDFKDYQFDLSGLPQFDTYDMKIVLYSSNKYIYPKIANYRLVIVA